MGLYRVNWKHWVPKWGTYLGGWSFNSFFFNFLFTLLFLFMYKKTDHFLRFSICLLRLLQKQNALHLPIFSIFFFFSTTCPEYRRIGNKKYFTDYQTANTVQLFVAIKGTFFGLFFFWIGCSKGNFPKDYLINVTTCSFK